MKAGIHPKYVVSTVTCACGNTFETKSTRPTLRTDLCNVCHPFYTGEQRIVDTAGQVERFLKRVENAGNSGPSKRQQRLQERAAREAAERQRAEEAARAEAAEAAAARAAARAAAEAEAAAQIAAAQAAAPAEAPAEEPVAEAEAVTEEA
jgi:large subunit ribosomal protein L31